MHVAAVLVAATLLAPQAGDAQPGPFPETPGCVEGAGGPDRDGDGVAEPCDRCLGFDDRLDSDSDSVPDGCDMCPEADDRVDVDQDGVPDGCDLCVGGSDFADEDADGIPDACDRCPGAPDSADADADGTPDACDRCELGDDRLDRDKDSVPDACDACEGYPDEADRDRDGIADACDPCPDFDERLRSSADLVICRKDGLVGVEVRKRRIGDVLDEMAALSGFEIFMPQRVADQMVSVAFEPLPIEKAIRRVLQGTSFTARYTAADEPGRPARLAEVRVLGEDGSNVVATVMNSSTDDPDLSGRVRNGESPQERVEAIGQLVAQDHGLETRRVVIGALQDPAPEVRRAALDAAVELGSGAGTSAIARIARNDTEPELRMQALRVLSGNGYPRGTAIAILDIAMRDSDSGVSDLARDLKTQLAASRDR